MGAKTTASDGRPCGVLMQVRLTKPMESATLTYKVKFSRDFDWTLGGKCGPPLVQCVLPSIRTATESMS